MVGKTNVSGARLRSIIAVTYPEGSVCTCSNGTKTLKARGTSGEALFNVPTGTWTVTATDGSRTTSNTVSIMQEGQIESVTLFYTLILYDNGNENNSVTGGWIEIAKAPSSGSSAGPLTITRNTENIVITGPSPYYGGVFIAKNKMNLTVYNKLVFKGTLNNTTASSAYLRVCVWSDLGEYWFENIAAVFNAPAQQITNNAEIDISALVGEFSIGFGLFSNSDGIPSATMKQMWAE